MASSLKDVVFPSAKPPRYLFFSGKGGVGKTTISSATAVHLARRGLRVLQVSTDLQKSLNDIYQHPIGETPTPITSVPNLWAVNVETAESMERHRGKIMKTFQLLDPDSLMLKQMRDDRMTDCGCAQAAVFELVEYLNSSEYDVIVFDTAPAGSTLEKIEAQSRSVLTLVNQVETKKKLLLLFGDDRVAEQLAELEEIRRHDERAFEVMRSAQTMFAMIMLAEALPFAELTRGIEDLEQRFEIPVRGIVINNVLPESEREASSFWRDHWKMQDRYIGLVHEKYPERAISEILLLSTESVGVDQLSKVADALYGEQSSPKLTVHIFPAPSASSLCDPSSPCDCGIGDSVAVAAGEKHPNDVIREHVQAIEKALGGTIAVDVADYSSNNNIYAAIDKLNVALKASGKDFLVSPANFYAFVGTVGPLIAIDGQISFTRKPPSKEQLLNSIQSALQTQNVRA